MDDNPDFLAFLERYLTSIHDPSIVVTGRAVNGREAVEMCRKLRPDLLLMDAAMPEMNGMEAAEAIRSADGVRPKIIIITAYDEDEYRLAAERSGVDSFIVKSEMFEMLPRVLLELFADKSSHAGNG